MHRRSATPFPALCSAAETLAANGPFVALAADAMGKAPEWVQIFPRGPRLEAVDGRAWTLDDPAALAAAFAGPLSLDYEHGHDLRAPKGRISPASGSLVALTVRDGVPP